MTTEAQWAIGLAGSSVAVVIGAVGALIRAGYRFGAQEAANNTRLRALETIVEQIAADVRELLRERRHPSQPDWNHGEEE